MSNTVDRNYKKYGYARVSSKSQEANSSLESQKQESIANGILENNIIIEVGSAINEIKNRPGFQNLIQNVLKEGDTLVVTKIDRCARNTLEFLKLQDILFKRKIQFISLDLPYSEDLNINKLIGTTLSSIAEFETNRRKERQMQGIYAAKKAGKYRGRKTVITKKLIAEVKYLKQNKMLSVSQIVKITGKSRNTIYKVLKEELGYVSNRLVEACFVVDNPYWQGTVVTFSGLSAKFFYMLLQEKKLRGEAFSDSILGRFDIYYRREDRETDKTLPEDFLEACHKKVRKTNQNVSFEKNQKGLILKLGNRKGNNYCRIYKEKTSLKFEYEMKGQLLRKYHSLLISNCLEELENLMCEGFLRHFGKLLPLEESFTDWLVVKLRPLRKQKLSFATFHSHYLEEKKFNEGGERKKFFMLLQFLNYAQNLDYERGALGSTTYRQVIFQVKDFLEYQKKSNNYYQLKKLIEFFDELQTNSLIKFFSDKEYRSLVTIPEVALTKGKQNCWVGRVWISEELFRYSHPFILPNLITKKLTKHEVEVQFKVIQVFSSVNIAKTFWIKDFFEDYSVKLTNQQKTKMKNYFIECLQQYKEHGLVDGNYKIISKGKAYSTKKLTSKVISEGFIVYEKLYV